MKIINTCLTLLSLCVISISALHAQTAITGINTENILPHADAAHPCISDEVYTQIESRCTANLHVLGLDHAVAQRALVALGWPLRMANGLQDNSYYIISAYVDQDQTAGAIRDWNCGTTTYDTHRGTDICTYPYPFYKMDHDQVRSSPLLQARS